MAVRTVKINFYLRMERFNPETKEAPIYARITVGGKRLNFAINRMVNPERWEQTNKLEKARKAEDRELGFYLESIRTRIQQIERELLEEKIPITAENILNTFTGKNKKTKTLLEVFEYHNRNFNALVQSGQASDGTLKRYTTVLKHLKEFLHFQYNRNDILLEELEYSFVTHLDFYFRTERKCNNNSSVKYIRNFRKIIKVAIEEGWLKYDVFSKYKGRLIEVTKSYLTPDEIEAIQEKEISIKRIAVIRDIFLFSVYTGYAYSDVQELTYNHIFKHIDNQLWIFKKRKKTGIDENVMLLQPALDLIEKYKQHPKCIAKGVLFPVPTNQKVNSYLKEIADLCGINKVITFHTARHTFATTIMVGNGVPLEVVKDVIGHSNIKHTQQYAKMLNSKVSQDMIKLNEKLKKSSKGNSDNSTSVDN